MQQLEKLLKKLEDKSKHEAFVNDKISKSPVGWHIEHTLLTINKIITAIENSNPAEYKKSKFSFAKLFVFTFQKIPRGRIQAPDSVRPVNIVTDESLKNHFSASYLAVKRLRDLKKDNYFVHPFFGKLNLKPAIKFMRIHTRHHLHIINDILKTGKAENNTVT